MVSLFLSNLWTGKRTKLKPRQNYHLSGLDRYRIIIDLDNQDEDIGLWVNDQKVLLPKDKQLPIYADREGCCKLKVISFGNVQRFSLDVPKDTLLDDNSLLPAIKLFAKASSNLSEQDSINKLLTLPFFSPSVIQDTLNDREAQELDDEISSALPSLLRVCGRPRRALISEKRVMPIDRVKRISANSLEHLASHPELWQSRNLIRVTPSRLKTDVPEETLDLYENRVVITIIRRLLKYLLLRSREIDRAYYQTEALHENLFTDYCFNRFRDERFRQLWSNQVELVDNYDESTELKNKIDKQLSQVSSFLDSGLYKTLRNQIDVLSPLKPTNILLMDEDYHKLFKLWQKLDGYELNRDSSNKMSVESDPQADYFQYIYGCILLALRLIGFDDPQSSDNIPQDNNVLYLDHWRVAVSIESNRSIVLIELTSDNTNNTKIKSCKYIFIMPTSRYITGDINQVRQGIEDLKKSGSDFLDNFFRTKSYKREQVDILASLVIVHPTDIRDRQSIGESVPKSLIRQMLSIGHNFLEKASYKQKKQKLGSKAALTITPIGMIPASPLDINTLERFQHLILLHTFGHDLMNGIEPVRCPVCHKKQLKQDSTSGLCLDCNARWSWSTCQNCSGKVPNLEPDIKLRKKNYINQPYAVYAMALEQLSGRDQLSAMCESHDFNESQRIRVICPHCGNCPGKGDTLLQCERCQTSEFEQQG